MMSLVRAQLGEPQQSSLLTALFSFDGMLIRTDKQFRHLKNSQKEKISNWLYDEYRNAYDKIGQAPDSRRNEEIVSAVYEKIEECGIWIPYYEVEKFYCSKKNKYR